MDLQALFETCLHIRYRQTGVSANYALLRDGRTMYVFFEDSDGKTDWKNNLDFPAKAYRRLGDKTWFAHRGFLRVWKELEPVLKKDLLDPYFKKIVIAGYSHGAAIAVLCHEYVWFHRPELRSALESYGFGCPRALWGIYGKKFKTRWERFTVVRNLNDLVTHLPPWILGYRHVGTLLKIGTKGKYSPIEAHRADNIERELRNFSKTANP